MAVVHRSIFIVLYFVYLSLSFADFVFRDNSENEEYCRVPNKAEGICKPYLNCTPFVDWLHTLPKPLSIPNKKLLISYQCGFTVNCLKVCCPNTTNVEPQITTEPQKRAPLISYQIPDVTQHKHLQLVPQKNCGIVDTSDRILNGNVTALFEFPWMALISYKTAVGLQFQCGGTLINDRYILTAAHCVTDLGNRNVAGVRLGEYDISTLEDCDTYSSGDKICADAVQDVAVEEVIPHPKFTRNSKEISNDIGLIRLAKAANLTANNVRSICLPITRDINNPDLTTATITGWGQTHTDLSSNVLMKLQVALLSHADCAKLYENVTSISRLQMCSKTVNQRDSCRGDSGGPIQTIATVNNDIRYVQYGILSFGANICGQEKYPAVYTKVANYLDWILDNIKT